jgi:16S rRNA (guanine966-N2)-methyltransferase
MRVIAGTYRSRQLSAPSGLKTRPTSDRLRETLFNILAARMDGGRFVDLYAGTGAVGIEAISRGAEHVWFAENAEPALASLRQNLATLKISRGFTLEDRGVGAMLQRLGKLTQPVDIV